jgi:hypothetical protein
MREALVHYAVALLRTRAPVLLTPAWQDLDWAIW